MPVNNNPFPFHFRTGFHILICLARRAGCFSRQAYVMLLLFLSSSSFLAIACGKEISETTRPIFTNFFKNGRHVGVDVRSGVGFPIGQGTLPWQPI